MGDRQLEKAQSPDGNKCTDEDVDTSSDSLAPHGGRRFSAQVDRATLHPPTRGKELLNSPGGEGREERTAEESGIGGETSWLLDGGVVDAAGVAGIVAQSQKTTQPVQGLNQQLEGDGGMGHAPLLVARNRLAGGGSLQNESNIGGLLEHSSTTGAGGVGADLG